MTGGDVTGEGTASVYLQGVFHAKEDTISAMQELKANGVTARNLDVFSDEPLELPRGVLDRSSHMSLLVVSGAIAFFLSIVGFVYYTQVSYPLVTGGMPIFSFWSTGVVFFEITMLGSILTTLACFLWESGLLRRDKNIPVPHIAPGTICIRVHCAPAQTQRMTDCFRRAGAAKVEKLGGSV